MGVEFTGDWQRCMKALDNLANKTRSEMGKKIGQSIKKIEAKVLAHVDNNQDLAGMSWTPAMQPGKPKRACPLIFCGPPTRCTAISPPGRMTISPGLWVSGGG